MILIVARNYQSACTEAVAWGLISTYQWQWVLSPHQIRGAAGDQILLAPDAAELPRWKEIYEEVLIARKTTRLYNT